MPIPKFSVLLDNKNLNVHDSSWRGVDHNYHLYPDHATFFSRCLKIKLFDLIALLRSILNPKLWDLNE